MLETPAQTSGPATVSEGSPERDDAVFKQKLKRCQKLPIP